VTRDTAARQAAIGLPRPQSQSSAGAGVAPPPRPTALPRPHSGNCVAMGCPPPPHPLLGPLGLLEEEGSHDIMTGRHWRRPANAMLREYGLNAFKSLARSHPAVFAAHHPDLLVEEDGQVVRRSTV
jgi:hypothetical protein